MRESDKQLLSLFSKLESDMVDLKTLCSEGGRGRTASISSVGMSLDPSMNNSSTGLRYDMEGYSGFSSSVKILEESEYQLDRTSSNESLENFADLLGEDDMEESMPRTSLKSQGSNFSDFNSNLSLHDNDRISTGGGANDMRALDDALSMTSQSSGSSTRLNVTSTSSPHMSHVAIAKNHSQYSSNDSGALVDSEPNILSANTTTTNGGMSFSSPADKSSITATLTDNDEAKRLSGLGLAGEIFALLNMK